MKTVIATAGLLLAGVLTWQIGGRLSTDAVSMGVGLVFGVLAGVPVGALVAAAIVRRSDGTGDTWDAGYSAGVRDTTNMARGLARQLPEHRPAVSVVNPPAADDDMIDADYTYAYPFGRRQFRITGEVEG